MTLLLAQPPQSRLPLFPGKSCFPLSAEDPQSYADRMDQLNIIFDVIGTPSESDLAPLVGDVRAYLERLKPKQPRSLAKVGVRGGDCAAAPSGATQTQQLLS